jgi:predicted DNA-binding protein (MmcQ/YjbR family)
MADKELENWEEYARQKKSDDRQTADLLKDSLKIVDKLAKMDADDIFANDDDDREELEDLIEKAKKLTKHRLWKLK